MISEERLKQLVSSGIGSKPYNINKVVGSNIVADFMDCKIDVLVIECDCQGNYSSGMQVSLLEKFPELKQLLAEIPEEARTLGNIVPITVVRRFKHGVAPGYIINAYTRKTSGWGMRRERVVRKHDGFLMPVSHFYPDAITDALSKAFEYAAFLVGKKLLHKRDTIACPRICRGVGGANWSDVETAILKAVDAAKTDIRVYLPRNPDNQVILGDNSRVEANT